MSLAIPHADQPEADKPRSSDATQTEPAPPLPPSDAGMPDPGQTPVPPAPVEFHLPPIPPWRHLAALPLFIALPFAVLYWCCPFFSKMTLGNDYPLYSIGQQMELLFSLRHNTFPLYWPRPGDGFSAATLTLGQLYHPITWIAGSLPGYWNGQALELNTLLRLISLGLTHYVLFRFLRLLSLGRALALTLSFIAVYNLRMLDMFRYGASLENYTAWLLLAAVIGFECLRPPRVWGFCWIALATYLLTTGGHPQMMYYGFLGAGALLLLMPFYLAVMLPGFTPSPGRLARFWLFAGCAMACGVLMASLYVTGYLDFLRFDSPRVGLDYDFAVGSFQNSPMGLADIFVNPFRADIHGNFGGSALILLAGLLPLVLWLRIRIPAAILALWLLLVLIMAYQTGSHTPVHYLFWRYFPFASIVREPGRMAMLNPLLLMLLLAWLVRLPPMPLVIGRRRFELPPYALLAAVLAVACLVFYLGTAGQENPLERFAPIYLKKSGPNPELNNIPAWVMVLAFALGLASLVVLALYGSIRPARGLAGAVLFLLVASQTGAVLRYGNWLELKTPTPTIRDFRKARQREFSNRFDWAERSGLSRAAQQYEALNLHRRAMLAWLAARYLTVNTQQESWKHNKLNGYEYETATIERFIAPREAKPKVTPGLNNHLRLAYGTVNRLTFQTTCTTPSFLVLEFPYNPERWQATLNGHETTIYRANGYEQAVRVPVGASTVEFRFQPPWIVLGAALTAGAWCILVLLMLTRLPRGVPRLIAMGGTVLLFTFLFLLWRISLYAGYDVGTIFYKSFMSW